MGASTELAAAAPHVCSHCGAAFASRNRVFRHLSEGCDVSAAKRREEKERVVFVIGYLGSKYHGCAQDWRDEEGHPTVEGALVAAVNRAWGDGIVLSVARAVRTERGAHAMENILVLTLRPTASRSQQALVSELSHSEIWLLALVSGSPGSPPPPAVFDKVYAPWKRVFRCYVPYAALLPAGPAAAPTEEAAGGLWLGPVHPDSAPEDVVRLLAGCGVAAAAGDVEMTPGRGQAEVRLPDAAVGVACAALNGSVWRGQALLAVPAAEARGKFAVQRRVRAALRLLRGPPKGVRSFHTFIADARPGEASAMRQLQHCAAGNAFSEIRNGNGAAWEGADWTTVTFSAADFGAQQVRRMLGVLVAVVRGSEGPEYVRRCFDAQGGVAAACPAPAAPAESVCLEAVELGPRGTDWRAAASAAGADAGADAGAAAAARLRRALEARVAQEAARPWREFAAALDAGAARPALAQRLADAAAAGDAAAVRAALGAGAPLAAANEYGQTPAFLAALEGHAEALQALVERRADVAQAANGGVTPHRAALERGHGGALRVLAALGGDAGAPEPPPLPPPARPPGRQPEVTEVLPRGTAHPGAGTVLVDGAFDEGFLAFLDGLWRRLPVAPREKASCTERAYFCDVEGWVTAQLDRAVAAAGLPGACESMRQMRFLWYPEPGGFLPQHVDLPRTDPSGRRSTFTFLLYLSGGATDTEAADGGETLLLDALDGDAALAPSGGVAPGRRATLGAVRPRRGRLLLMPHACPHAAAPVAAAPKVLVRGEVLPPPRA